MLHAGSSRYDGQTVAVGSDQEISIQRLAGLMMEVCGFTGEITRHSSPRDSVHRRVPLIGKLQSLTLFAPRSDYETASNLPRITT